METGSETLTASDLDSIIWSSSAWMRSAVTDLTSPMADFGYDVDRLRSNYQMPPDIFFIKSFKERSIVSCVAQQTTGPLA
jgi:hypothetical protein